MRPTLRFDQGVLCCYACGGIGAASTSGEEFLADRAVWPTQPCYLTAGCNGVVVPEVLN